MLRSSKLLLGEIIQENYLEKIITSLTEFFTKNSRFKIFLIEKFKKITNFIIIDHINIPYNFLYVIAQIRRLKYPHI